MTAIDNLLNNAMILPLLLVMGGMSTWEAATSAVHVDIQSPDEEDFYGRAALEAGDDHRLTEGAHEATSSKDRCSSRTRMTRLPQAISPPLPDRRRRDFRLRPGSGTCLHTRLRPRKHPFQHLAELGQVGVAKHRLMIARSELDHYAILRDHSIPETVQCLKSGPRLKHGRARYCPDRTAAQSAARRRPAKRSGVAHVIRENTKRR